MEYSFKNILESFIFKDIKSVLIEKPTERFSFFEDSKILLIRNDRIGDLLVSSPFLKTFRKYCPNVTIDILLSEKNIAARRVSDNFVNNTFIYSKSLGKLIKLIYILRKRKYDLVIDLLDNPSTTNAFIIKFINPLYSLGFRKSKSNKYNLEILLPTKLKTHIVERINQLLLPFDIVPAIAPKRIEFKVENHERTTAKRLLGEKVKPFRIGINLSGSSSSKFWGLNNYAYFIAFVNKNYSEYQVVVFYTKDNKSIVDRLSEDVEFEKAPLVSDFNLYAAMIAECDIILSPDTAAVHLAAAFGIPCIALYLFSGTKETGMPWTPYHSPSKCLKTGTDNLSNIPLEAVCESFEELIAEHNLYE